MKKKLGASVAVATILIGATLSLSGCSTAQPTVSPTVTSSPTPTRIEMTEAEALKNFKAAVDASMALADSQGLTQTTTNDKWGEYVLVLDRKYNADYSAAVKNADGTVELIYEAYAFAPWSAWESIETYDAKVRWDADTNEYVVTQMIENDPVEYRYKVQEGLIVAESGSSTDSSWSGVLVYSVDDAGHKIIDDALKTLE